VVGTLEADITGDSDSTHDDVNEPRQVVPDDSDAVIEANRAFYRAFEAGDLDAMSDVWEHSDRVSCGHPGWATLHGWSEVVASWMTLFSGGGSLQFILTNERVHRDGSTAWVTVDENILAGQSGSTVAAINVFVHRNGRWFMVAHHGAGVVDRQP
jgi:ketosteroid isomerase-like protein